MKVCPFTIIVPLLAVPVLAATEKENVPGPFPFGGTMGEIAIQETVLTGDHVQPFAVTTFTVPFPPAAENDCDAGFSEKEQSVTVKLTGSEGATLG